MNDDEKAAICDAINFAEIVKGRYTSDNPKITYIVETDIFNRISVYKFGVIKLENNRLYGWEWDSNRIKLYKSFIINSGSNYIDTVEIKGFIDEQSAKNYAMWLVFNGGKILKCL